MLKRNIISGLVGLSAGLLIATAIPAKAEVISLVGKVIQGEFAVSVGDKELQDKALVIDGTSYAPVRAIGEAAGFEVTFDPNKGIKLNRNSVDKDTDWVLKTKIGDLKSTISGSEDLIKQYQAGLDDLLKRDKNGDRQDQIDYVKEQIEHEKTQLSKYKKDLADLEKLPTP
jgi:hypothetical protein